MALKMWLVVRQRQNNVRLMVGDREPEDTSREITENDRKRAEAVADTAAEVQKGYYDLILVEAGLDIDSEALVK